MKDVADDMAGCAASLAGLAMPGPGDGRDRDSGNRRSQQPKLPVLSRHAEQHQGNGEQ